MNFTYTNVKHYVMGGESVICADVTEIESTMVIIKSLSSIYKRQIKPSNGTLLMQAMTYTNTSTLNNIRFLILGGSYVKGLTTQDKEELGQIFIRVGWLDKKLFQLKWIPLVDLIQRFVDGTLTKTENGKFREVCKALSLSYKDARRFHGTKDNRYNPKRVLGVNNG